MKDAMARRMRSSRFMDSSFLNESSKVDGSMLGKSLSATGSSSSMNGTITNTDIGSSRNRSVVVRT